MVNSNTWVLLCIPSRRNKCLSGPQIAAEVTVSMIGVAVLLSLSLFQSTVLELAADLLTALVVLC